MAQRAVVSSQGTAEQDAVPWAQTLPDVPRAYREAQAAAFAALAESSSNNRAVFRSVVVGRAVQVMSVGADQPEVVWVMKEAVNPVC